MRRAALLLALTLVGCSILEPRPDTSRFFTLSAVAEAPDPPSDGGLAVGLGPVRVPVYLDRPELATRVATTEVVFSPTDRWAEPLSASIRRVVAENLSLVLGTEEIATYPWPVGTRVDWTVALDVGRFERNQAGAVEVAARWVVREGAGGRIRIARDSRHTQKANGDGTAAAVEAWNEALAALSSDIAQALVSLGRPPRETASR
jgi:uncharacterized lipoprotein YmbA